MLLVALLAEAVSHSPSSATPSDSPSSSCLTKQLMIRPTAASSRPDCRHINNTRWTRSLSTSMCWATSSSWANFSRGASNRGSSRSYQQGKIGQGWIKRRGELNRSSSDLNMKAMGTAHKKRRGSAAAKSKKEPQYIQIEDLESDSWR